MSKKRAATAKRTSRPRTGKSPSEYASEQGIYTLADVCRLLGCSARTLKAARREGLIARRFTDRRLVILGRDLARFISGKPQDPLNLQEVPAEQD